MIFVEKNMLQVEKIVSVLSNIAKSHMCTVSQVALNWLASNPLVIPIPGVKNPAQAKENLGSLDFQLSLQELNEIEKVCREIKIDYYPSAEGEQIEMAN
jgi:aryl-alcohol dehydrogenase-like predicted oxidoreductase